jgi:hypothetical protein
MVIVKESAYGVLRPAIRTLTNRPIVSNKQRGSPNTALIQLLYRQRRILMSTSVKHLRAKYRCSKTVNLIGASSMYHVSTCVENGLYYIY